MERDSYVVVKCDGFVYYGSFYKCCINLPKGQKWKLVYSGPKFAVCERRGVTIEMEHEDYVKFFEPEGGCDEV